VSKANKTTWAVILSATLIASACTTSADPSAENDSGSVSLASAGAAATGLDQDLAASREELSSVNRSSSYRLLDIPSLGEFYVPAVLLKDIRKNWSQARVKLRTNPHDAAALRILAVHELALGNYEGANTYIAIARSAGVGFDDQSSLLMALAQLAAGNVAGSEVEFDRASTTSQGYSLAHLNRGMYALAIGSASQAVAQFSAVISRDESNLIARLHLGQAYYLLRKFKSSVAEFDRVIDLDASNALALYNRGIVLHRGLRQYGPARDSLEKVISMKGVSAQMKSKAAGAIRNLDRDSQGRDSLATIGAY
jgi:tetratricopeptide (TPR) repeat protein